MDEPTDRHPLHLRIKLARTGAGLTQTQLAQRLSVHPSAVGHWEVPNGTAPAYHRLYAIASITGCGIEWLATGRGVRSVPYPPHPADGSDVDPVERKVLEILRRVGVRRRTALVQFLERFCG
jgi:transcriptional regulator with XRE-family HTH domain